MPYSPKCVEGLFCELRPETVRKGVRVTFRGCAFGRSIGAKTGRTGRFGCLGGAAFRALRDFSDSFLTEFSEVPSYGDAKTPKKYVDRGSRCFSSRV